MLESQDKASGIFSGCHLEYASFQALVLTAFDYGKANFPTSTKG